MSKDKTPILSPTQNASRFALKKSADRYQLSEEVALEQLTLFLEYYDIDTSRCADLEVRRDAERPLEHLLDLVRLGKIEFKRDEKERVVVVHTLQTGETVTYSELNSKAKLAMDKHPAEAQYARKYALMGSLCGLGSSAIELFPARDLAVVDALAVVFMSA